MPETPPAKKQKTDEEAPLEEQMATGPMDELESDMKKDSSPKIKDSVTFLTQDTTMNIMPCTHGNMLVSLCDGGFQYLVAGARANVGVKSGRYVFEARIVEQMNPTDGPTTVKHGVSKNMFRIGFSTDSAGLFPGEDANSVCFDTEGFFIHNKEKTRCMPKIDQDTTIAIVLNRELGHPNCNTVSIFANGARTSQPQPLPDNLLKEILFPAISFRNATVHANFEEPLVPLPFKCATLSIAATKDVQVKQHIEPTGKYNVVFPVALPDEGGFEWLDDFLAKNPDYTELSDRSMAAWATNSGLAPAQRGKKASHDKLEWTFGAPPLDDGTCGKMLLQVAAIQPRNYVVMELRGNLLQESRKAAMAPFNTGLFTIKAEVIVGDPPQSMRTVIREHNLKAKQEQADILYKVRVAEAKKHWILKKSSRENKKKVLKLEREKKTRAEMLKRKFERDKLIREGKEVPPELQEPIQDSKDGIDSEDGLDLEPLEPEPKEDDPPKVELVGEEETTRFLRRGSGTTPDLTPFALSTGFSKFSIPDESEGFDEVKFSWMKKDKAVGYVKSWIVDKKSNIRLEDIVPSAEFKEKHAQWIKTLQILKAKQNQYKAAYAKKMAKRAAKDIGQKVKTTLAEQKVAKEAESAGGDQAETKQDELEGEVEAEDELVDFDKLDVFAVSDVVDVGGGMPLVKEFSFEDFVLLSLRVEMHILSHSFVRDADDPDRTGIKLDHLQFYYERYYGKKLTFKSFGVESAKELLALIEDTIWTSKDVMQSLIPWDMEGNNVFVKITEEARRHRKLRLELGDDSAKLNFSHAPVAVAAPQEQSGGGGKGWQKGGWNSWNSW